MKTKNALTVRPDPGLPELKRAGNLIRITERILATPTVPARNRTDEHGRKQGRWTEFVDGDVYEGSCVDDERHGKWVVRLAKGGVWEYSYVNGKLHGKSVVWKANGDVIETCRENGKKVDC